MSKFVHHPFELDTVTVVQVVVQFVGMVRSWLAATSWLTVGLPSQARVIVLGVSPPLNAWMVIKRRGEVNEKGSDVPSGGNEMLLVAKPPHGPDSHHWLTPQSITPIG